ncbi:MAG: lipopolysaccharide transport periplasmic protein LptA [Ottowia sp.]|nr:lipopolysaccharide transport periplasmic protein LptA [Ottowia sp.]
MFLNYFAMPQFFLPLFAAVFLFLSTGVHAAKADRDKPLLFQSDHFSYDDLKQVYLFTGSVVLTKGSMLLQSATAQVRISAEGDEYAVAMAEPGKLVFLKQKTDNHDEFIEGYGERVEYDVRKDVFHLIGKARLKRLVGNVVMDDVQGQSITRDGVRAVYQARGGTAVPQGQSDDQRVRITIGPRNARGSMPVSEKK